MLSDQYRLDLHEEIIVDNFAGGGGASTGIELALGRCVDVAINHDPDAVAMHRANHPQTKHYCASIYDVDPIEATGGRPVGLCHFSPDCKHFSKAKGAKPRSKQIRGLAWVVIDWVRKVSPRVILLENVEEFQTWGPLGRDGCPKGHRRGWYFDCFIGALRRRGYAVEWQELRACDYGAPTIRKRLYLIARRDGRPIVWPEPTHFKQPRRGQKRWRSAAECIDFGLPCPSIFERSRPLAEATCRRIATGIVRYVIDAQKPFIIQTGYGERAGQAPRVPDIEQPLGTVVAGGVKHALIMPHLTEFANASSQRNMPADEPLRTQCAQTKGGHFALVSAFLAKHYSGVIGRGVEQPLGTVTTTDHHSLVACTLARQFGESTACDIKGPAPTVMANGLGKTQLIAASLCKMRGTNVGSHPGEPLHTISAQGTHHALVAAFLSKYYGSGVNAQSLDDPMHTVRSRDCFQLVTVEIDGTTYAIVDIGLRMLQPHELYLAQGFPRGYIHDWGYFEEQGRLWRKSFTKTAQVRMVGNSVSPAVECALVAANLPDMVLSEKGKRAV